MSRLAWTVIFLSLGLEYIPLSSKAALPADKLGQAIEKAKAGDSDARESLHADLRYYEMLEGSPGLMSDDEAKNLKLIREALGPTTSAAPPPAKVPSATPSPTRNPDVTPQSKAPNYFPEDISYFGWRKGDTTTFKIGEAVGYAPPYRIELKEEASMVRTVEKVTRTKNRVVAEVLDTTRLHYAPAGKIKMTYVADSNGIYVDVEILEGPNRGVKSRNYVARFPLAENVIDKKYGTVLRKFGRPAQMPPRVPDENCILIKIDAGLFKYSAKSYSYETYCQGVGLVSASDDKPDLEAGVPGPASTFVYLVEKFKAGPSDDSAPSERSPK